MQTNRDFVEAYRDAQQEMNEYACETQKETCEYQCQNGQYQYQNDNNNNNYNNGDNYCYYTCMSDNGMSFCDDNNNGGQDINELMECRQLGGDNNNNNNNNQYYYGSSSTQIYYVGAYCTSDGVHVATFTDSQCTKFAPSGTYEKHYGYSLPTTNLVGTDCISCKATSDDDNNNNNNNNYVSEFCQDLYQDASKCEENMKDHQYPNNDGCDLMHYTLPRLDKVMHGRSSSSRPAVALAWFFGISLALLTSYVVWFHYKLRKNLQDNQVNLLPTFPGVTMS
jgi:hypothetical protein